jgi:hypothetical protein
LGASGGEHYGANFDIPGTPAKVFAIREEAVADGRNMVLQARIGPNTFELDTPSGGP